MNLNSKIMDTLYEIEYHEKGTCIETLCKMVLYKEKDKRQFHNYLHSIGKKKNIDYFACYNILKGCYAMREYQHFNIYLKQIDDNKLRLNMKLFYKLRTLDKKEMIYALLRCRPKLNARVIFREKIFRQNIHKLPTVILLMMAITNSTIGIRDFMIKFIIRGDIIGNTKKEDSNARLSTDINCREESGNCV